MWGVSGVVVGYTMLWLAVVLENISSAIVEVRPNSRRVLRTYLVEVFVGMVGVAEASLWTKWRGY